MVVNQTLVSRWAEHDPLAIARELVRFPTYGDVLGVEAPAVEWLAARFRRLGIPHTVRSEHGRAFNLTARIGEGGPSIILNSHLDVVPPGDSASWATDPFEPHVADGRLYGRGSCDAKGSVAAMVAAFERLYARRRALKGTVILALVGGEERGGEGVCREIAQGLKADAAIVGEPTGLMPRVAHKGRVVLEVVTRGKPAHSSNPDAGVNAISAMARLLPGFEALHGAARQVTHPLLGAASSAVTRIAGGVAVNVVPAECRIWIDRRLLPGEVPDRVIGTYREVIERGRAADPALEAELIVLEVTRPAEAGSTALPGILQEVGGRVLGRPVGVGGFPATCDMTHLVHKAGVPTVIFGPGDLEAAHRFNEWISVAELYQAAEVYYQTCLAWTGSADSDAP